MSSLISKQEKKLIMNKRADECPKLEPFFDEAHLDSQLSKDSRSGGLFT